MDAAAPPGVDDDGPAGGPGRFARSKASATALTNRAREGAERVRDEVPAANAGWEAYLDDAEIGGPLISGAVAFRLFLWLLPMTLVTVVGFGFLAEAGGSSPESMAKTAGIRGIAAQSIAQATSSSTQGRWLLLAVGLIALVSTSRSLLKALWRCHELAWHAPRTKAATGTGAVLALLGLAAVALGTTTAVAKLREVAGLAALPVVLLAFAVWGGLWLVASILLPHGEAPWTALLPGAVLVGVAAEVLRLVTVYYVAGKVGSSSEVYGGLGAAAALLTWLFLVARTTVGAAVLNATLWQRRCRGTPSGLRRRSSRAGGITHDV
jgi:uncharacterized BrkB/YihY/UPF0761 family membrane protein